MGRCLTLLRLCVAFEVEGLKVSQAEEVRCLRGGKPVPPSSKLSMLAPELDPAMGLIRLHHIDSSSPTDIHPVDPNHAVTGLLIKDMDAQLHRSGSNRVFAEMRHHYWVLWVRQAIKKYQRACVGCMKWRGKPVVQRMADPPVCGYSSLHPSQPVWTASGRTWSRLGDEVKSTGGLFLNILWHGVYIWICSSALTEMLSS